MSRLLKLLERRWSQVRWGALLLETAFYLVIARLALKHVRFQRLTPFFERPARQPELAGEQRAQVRSEVQRAIWMVASRLPGKMVCFPRAIAAQALLRRRGVGTVLYYGARTEADKGLNAHVWVQDGAHPVVGKRSAEGLRVLSRYPSAP